MAAIVHIGPGLDFEEEGGARARLEVPSHKSVTLPPNSRLAWFTLFKIQHFHPARLRLAHGDDSTHLRRGDIAVTLHDVDSMDMEKKLILTSAQPLTRTADVGGALAIINETLFASRIFRCKADDDLTYTLPNVPGVDVEMLHIVTRQLVQNQALPGRGMRYTLTPTTPRVHEQREVLRRLQELCLVDCFEAEGQNEEHGTWALTVDGLAEIRPLSGSARRSPSSSTAGWTTGPIGRAASS